MSAGYPAAAQEEALRLIRGGRDLISCGRALG
jgi:hypothetical protein